MDLLDEAFFGNTPWIALIKASAERKAVPDRRAKSLP
jgi:hypothetical protein